MALLLLLSIRMGATGVVQNLGRQLEPTDLWKRSVLFFISALLVTLSSSLTLAQQRCAEALYPIGIFDKNVQYLYIGHQRDNGKYLMFQPPHFKNRVDLKTPFAHFEQFSDMVMPLAQELKGVPPHIVAEAARYEWQVRHTDLLYSINFGVMRSRMFKAQNLIHPTRPLDAAVGKFLADPLNDIIGPLYESYRAQGPEREQLLPKIIEQDQAEADRYVRFSMSRFIKPMGYLQMLLSRNSTESLHVTEAWGDQVADLVRKSPDELVGELGRLHVVHPNKYEFDYHRALVDELKNEKGKLKTNSTITQMILQKAFSWSVSDAKMDRMIIQINEKVERVMKLNGIPLFLGERRVVEKTWEGGKSVREVIYAFDRPALLKAEEFLLSKVMHAWMEMVAENPLYQSHDRAYVKLEANEYAAFRRLGIYEKLFGKEALPEELEGSGIYFVMSPQQAPQAMSLLEQIIGAIQNGN